MKHFILSIIFIVIACHGITQSTWQHKRDSLLAILQHSKEDTDRVRVQLSLGDAYKSKHDDSAIYYAKTAGYWSLKLKYAKGELNSLALYSMILLNQNKLDEAMAIDSQAIDLAIKTAQGKELGRLYLNMGLIYDAGKNYYASLNHYLKAVGCWEKQRDSVGLLEAYTSIGDIYLYSKLDEAIKAHEYLLKAVVIGRSLKNEDVLTTHALLKLGISLDGAGRYDTAFVVLRQAKAALEKINDERSLALAVQFITCANLNVYNFDMIKKDADKLLAIAMPVDDKAGIYSAWIFMGEYYISQNNYDSAVYYSKKAWAYAKQNNLDQSLQGATLDLAIEEVMHGNFKGYIYYANLYDPLQEENEMDKMRQKDEELEVQYSVSKKQAQIDNLTKEQKIQQLTLRQRKIVNWALASTVLVIALVGFLYFKNNQNKKRLLLSDAALQHNRIAQLEQEKQLLAAQSVVQGQVEERTRLAKDLHDGLGGILSSAKYSFTNMKDNLIVTPENADAFSKGMAMLDQSITELRRVAHNMMPEALVKFGLDTALADYCNSINQSGAVQLSYQAFGVDEATVSKTTAAAIYRMVQELVNNTLKHAGATTALVQLVRKGNALSITVEDNGKGFNKDILQTSSGMGFQNLKDRIAYLKGSLDIETSTGKGTSINIEVPDLAG